MKKNLQAENFPIVGIGASAGGLEACEQFFTHLSPNTGFSFVLVQHLDPKRESMLANLLQNYTQMPVIQVAEKTQIEPNQVYVIPPNRTMIFQENYLILSELSKESGMRLTIDIFFRSLAAHGGRRAIAIILSGAGSDGSLSLKDVHASGGLIMAQDPDSAKYDSMPQRAIETGLVDYVLAPREMGKQLMSYIERDYPPPVIQPKTISITSEELQNIFSLLKKETGHDFSMYKKKTVQRRVEQRLLANRIEQVGNYIRYLKRNSQEIKILFKELLIGVTSFFRDTEAFNALKQEVIPELIGTSSPTQPIRVWIPGCAGGEEAYSLAILFSEYMEEIKQEFRIQIFATDINQEAIDKARLGLYPKSAVSDIAPERLNRFFKKEGEYYRINKRLREMIIFAVQNIIHDPPFSKLNLISCRNLLIYLESEMQNKILPRFHYALVPEGFLFLGISESLREFTYLFKAINRSQKIFQSLDVTPSLQTVLDFSPALLELSSSDPDRSQIRNQVKVQDFLESFLIKEYTPPCVVVNRQFDIFFIHNQISKYLDPSTGEANWNIIRMVREEFRLPLATILQEAFTHRKNMSYENISFELNDEVQVVTLKVHPITHPVHLQGLAIVIFQEIEILPQSLVTHSLSLAEIESHRINELEQELATTRKYLQAIIGELEMSNEELKATNEEFQTTNEELQSTNEALETTKEELQSVNEELVTVNIELEEKIEELTLANNDLNSLLLGLNVGIIFLDSELRIRRFNPAVTQIIHLIETDIGRPLKHFALNLAYENFFQDIQTVIDTLEPKSIEVFSHKQRSYLVYIQPFFTPTNSVIGVSITFADITAQKQIEDKLRIYQNYLEKLVEERTAELTTMNGQLQQEIRERKQAEKRFRVASELVSDYVYALQVEADGSLRKEWVTQSFIRDTGQEVGEYISGAATNLAIYDQDRAILERRMEKLLGNQEDVSEYRIVTTEGEIHWLRDYGRPIWDGTENRVVRVIGAAQDITEQKLSEQALQRMNRELTQANNQLNQQTVLLETILKQAVSGIIVCDKEGTINFVNDAARQMAQSEPEGTTIEMISEVWGEIYSVEGQRIPLEKLVLPTSLQGEVVVGREVRLVHDDGTFFDILINSAPLLDREGNIIGSVATYVDITSRKQLEDELKKHQTNQSGKGDNE